MILTGKDRWMMFWGLCYKVNLKSGEIHHLQNNKTTCNTHLISKAIYLTKRKALRFINNKGYNGCGHCWKEYNTKK